MDICVSLQEEYLEKEIVEVETVSGTQDLVESQKLYRLLCMNKITLCLIILHSSIMLENVEVKECKGKEVRRRT